ncbi:MAG: TrkA C-terminal domain-containing protein [Phycisphaerales bacterium]
MVIAPVISLLLVAFVSLLLIQIGARALRYTGLDPDVALLQAQSAFTGTGWTTAEAELVMNHPLRRRIIRHLMLVGALGVPSIIATVVVLAMSIAQSERSATTNLLSIPSAVAGLIIIWLVLHSKPFEMLIDWGIRLSLRHVGRITPVDYAQMLRVHAGYSVGEWIVEHESPLLGKRLQETRPGDRGVLILGVERASGEWVGAPDKDTVVRAGDTLTVYGRDDAIRAVLSGGES